MKDKSETHWGKDDTDELYWNRLNYWIMAFRNTCHHSECRSMSPEGSKEIAEFLEHLYGFSPKSNPKRGTNLFQLGNFTSHSGETLGWKIECDALTTDDWKSLAKMVVEILPEFGSVEPVPQGGIPFANALQEYVTKGPPLIVDDVLTTGGSMEKHRAGRDAVGVVAFARGPVPDWVKPIFKTSDATGDERLCLVCSNALNLKETKPLEGGTECPTPDDLSNSDMTSNETIAHWMQIAHYRRSRVKELATDNERLITRNKELEADNAKFREALTPSTDTKQVYWGQFSFKDWFVDDYGNDRSVKIDVPWTSIKEIMKSIYARAIRKEPIDDR